MKRIVFLVSSVFASWGTWEVPAAIRTDYKFRLTTLGDPAGALLGLETYWAAYYQIDIKIEPCYDDSLTGGRGNECCRNTGEVNCQDLLTGVAAGPDMHFAYMQNAHIATCSGTNSADDLNCGTFIEVHRSDNGLGTEEVTDSVAEVLASIPLENNNGAYHTEYISTSALCAGDYALWWVVRTRSGPYVQFQKNFQVIYPSC